MNFGLIIRHIYIYVVLSFFHFLPIHFSEMNLNNSGQCQVQITIDRDPNDGNKNKNKHKTHRHTHTHTQTRTKPNQNYNKKPTHSLESICKIYRKATIFSRYAIFTFCHFNNLFNLISITFIFRPFLFVAHSVFLSRSAFFNLNINFRCYIFFKNDPKHIFLSIVTRFRFNSHQYRHSMCGVVWFRVRSIHRQSLSWRYTLWLPDKQNSFYLFITSIWPGTRKAPSET